MVRAALRWTLRGIKGVLALVALAALVAWPWSYGHPGAIAGDRWRIDPERANCVWTTGRWGEGRVDARWGEATYSGHLRIAALDERPTAGPGWNVNLQWEPAHWEDLKADVRWGPLRWATGGFNQQYQVGTYGGVSLPCWLLALLTGAWPLASLALFVRRRRRLRRRARAGCCRRCGYDLRATPAPGGELLAMCPECGAVAGAGERLNSEL